MGNPMSSVEITTNEMFAWLVVAWNSPGKATCSKCTPGETSKSLERDGGGTSQFGNGVTDAAKERVTTPLVGPLPELKWCAPARGEF